MSRWVNMWMVGILVAINLWLFEGLLEMSNMLMCPFSGLLCLMAVQKNHGPVMTHGWWSMLKTLKFSLFMSPLLLLFVVSLQYFFVYLFLFFSSGAVLSCLFSFDLSSFPQWNMDVFGMTAMQLKQQWLSSSQIRRKGGWPVIQACVEAKRALLCFQDLDWTVSAESAGCLPSQQILKHDGLVSAWVHHYRELEIKQEIKTNRNRNWEIKRKNWKIKNLAYINKSTHS